MAFLAERKVLKILVAQLEQIPVRAAHRPMQALVIDVLKEMSEYESFHDGHFRTMENVEDMMRFYDEHPRLRKAGRPRKIKQEICSRDVKPRKIKRLTEKQILAAERRRKTMEEKAREGG